MLISRERLAELIHFDFEEGEAFNITTRRGGARAGALAGCINPQDGYWQIKLDYRLYKLHRLMWFALYGEWIMLDHINGDPSDNRLCNLRPCTVPQNAMNKKGRATSTSGVKGVHWDKSRQKWMATINSDGTGSRYIGRYDKLEDAAAAYAKEAYKYFGEFARV